MKRVAFYFLLVAAFLVAKRVEAQCVDASASLNSHYVHTGTKGFATFEAGANFKQTATTVKVYSTQQLRSEITFSSRSDDGTATTSGSARVSAVNIFGNGLDFNGFSFAGVGLLRSTTKGKTTTYHVRYFIEFQGHIPVTNSGKFTITKGLISAAVENTAGTSSIYIQPLGSHGSGTLRGDVVRCP